MTIGRDTLIFIVSAFCSAVVTFVALFYLESILHPEMLKPMMEAILLLLCDMFL